MLAQSSIMKTLDRVRNLQTFPRVRSAEALLALQLWLQPWDSWGGRNNGIKQMLSEACVYYQALDVPRVWFSLSCIDKVALGQEVLVSVLENPTCVYPAMAGVQGQKFE